MSKWEKPPPVVVLSGTEGYLRDRELHEAIVVAEESGRQVEVLEGTDRAGLRAALATTGILFKERSLVVVRNAASVDVELVLEHHAGGDGTVALLLHNEAGIREKSNLNRIVQELPSRLVARFERPKPWEEFQYAKAFAVKEAARRKLKIEPTILDALVRQVGTDLGVLSFELDKLEWLLGAEGEEREVSVDHLRGVVGVQGDMGPRPVVEALESRNVRSLAAAMTNVRRAHGNQISSATMRVLAFVRSAATVWLHVANLLRNSVPMGEIASRAGVHPFVARKVHVPVARRWGEYALLRLLVDLARIERGVRSGQVTPWVALECALFRALEPVDH